MQDMYFFEQEIFDFKTELSDHVPIRTLKRINFPLLFMYSGAYNKVNYRLSRKNSKLKVLLKFNRSF